MLEISVLPPNCIANLPHCIICSNACFFQSSAMFSICLPNIFADKGMHFFLRNAFLFDIKFFLHIRAASFPVTWRAGVSAMRLLVFLYWIVATRKRLLNIYHLWNVILWSTGLSITSWNVAEKHQRDLSACSECFIFKYHGNYNSFIPSLANISRYNICSRWSLMLIAHISNSLLCDHFWFSCLFVKSNEAIIVHTW